MKKFLITSKTTIKLTAMILTISLFFSVFASMPTLAEDTDLAWIDHLNSIWEQEKSGWKWETNTGGAPVWDGTVSAVTPVGNVYRITNGAQLAWVAQRCNSGSNNFENYEVRLMNDIDLGGRQNRNWTPIGLDRYFVGMINGNGKTIYNMYINRPTNYVIGLLGYTYKGAQINNLTMKSAKVIGSAWVSALVGYNDANMSDVRVENSWVESTNSGDSWVAPLASFPSESEDEFQALYTRCSSINNIVYGDAHVGGMFGIANRVTDSYSVGCTVISKGGHSGGFISCSDKAIEYRNCFVNNTVYGNRETGVFIGMMGCNSAYYTNTVIVENCYATGSIEGQVKIGGFAGEIQQGWYNNETEQPRPSNLMIRNCYSTAVVGMRNGGHQIGSFIGNFCQTDASRLRTFTIQNCYASGEVGGLDPTQNTKIGGFIGERDATITISNCYYDKQTTTMRETAVGSGPSTGITGLLTNSTKGNGNGLKMTGKALTGFDSSVWKFENEMYPQLKIFSDPTSAMFPNVSDRVLIKAYSGASVCAPILNAWDVLPATTAYDTLRDITLDFELTENAGYDLEWTNEDAMGAVETSKPVIEINNNEFSAHASAIGIDWLTVKNTVTQNGITVVGERALRVIPTKSLSPGLSTQVSAGRLYDSWADVSLVDASALDLSRYYEGTKSISPVTGNATKTRLEKSTAPAYANTSPYITDTNSAFYDYHSNVEVKNIFNGSSAIPENYAGKIFEIEYTWVLADGRYLTDSKLLDVPLIILHIRQAVINPNQLAEQLQMGYMRLNQVTTSSPNTPYSVSNITTVTGKDSDNPPYSDYRVTIDTIRNGYTLTPIIPQFYEYAGYLITDTNTLHDTSKREEDRDRMILLDLSDVNELWVTVYIQPTISKPTDCDTDVRVNDFGEITVP